ncbi:MAG: hypothetical protein R2698_15130 [Microthrixaceae bacterium]
MSELPTGWEWTTIGDLTLPVSKVDPRSEPDHEFDYIDIGGVDGDRGEILETQRLAGRAAPSRARQLVRAGDTVLSTVRTYMRKTALVPSRLDEQVASTGFSVLRPAEDVNPKYLYYAVRRQEFVDTLSSLQTGSSYPAVRDKDVRSMRVPLAPKAGQERIVAAIEEHFSRLDAAWASLRSAEARLGALESRAADEAFRSLGERVPVGELADVRGGIQKQPKRKPKDNPAPFLRVANVGHGRVNLDDVHQIELFDGELERCRLESGDLLVVEGNGSPDQIGRSAVWHGEIDPCVHQNHLIRVRPGPRLDPEFLGLYWNAPSTRAQLTAVASSTSGLHTLSTAKVKRVPVPAASVEKQRAVVEQLSAQNAGFEHLRESLRVAAARQATLRRAVLAAAFAGQLVPQDPDDEPASVLLRRIRAERQAATPTRHTRKAKVS